MNQLTQEITSPMIPKAALIAYSQENKFRQEYFLELREIDDQGKMGEGIPVTYEFMNEIARNYSEVNNGTPYGTIPKNLLYCDTRKGSEKYVWFNPPGKRMMYFVKNLGIENAEYNLPGVIYVAKENKLDVYAYKG